MRNLILPASLLVALGGCDIVDPEFETELGAVFFFSNPPQITIPDTVAAGQPFTVTVHTFGNGCVEFARTEVEEDENTVEIRPYDRIETDRACEEILKTIDHSVTLRFGVSGPMTVRVVGKRMPNDDLHSFEKRVIAH